MALTSRTAAHPILDKIPPEIAIIDSDLLGSYARDERRFTGHAVPGAGRERVGAGAELTGEVVDRWVGVGRVGVGTAREAGAAAVREAVTGRQPVLLLMGCSADYDPVELVAGVVEVVGQVPMIGTTTGSVSRSARGGVVVVAFGGVGFAAATAGAAVGAAGLRHAGARAAACVNDVAGSAHQVLVLMSDGATGDQQEVVRGAYQVTGAGVPLVGAAGGAVVGGGASWQVRDGRVFTGAVVAAALGSQAPFGVGVGHGWQPVGAPMLATASTGNVVHELDDQPALQVYVDRLNQLGATASLAGTDSPGWDAKLFARVAGTHPLGLLRRSGHQIRSVVGGDPASGSLICAAEVPPAALASLMTGDATSVLAGADQACRNARAGLDGQAPLGLLVFNCVARRWILGDGGAIQEAHRIATHAEGAVVGGVYTFGEFARTQGFAGFHNKTLVVLAVG